MRNISTKLDDDTLVITVNLAAKGERSASGKTQVIASSQGNQAIPGTNPQMYLGLNVYHK